MGRTILAIDPGPEKSGWVTFDGQPCAFGIKDNTALIADMRSQRFRFARLAIEMTESRGMPVGKSVHETTFWIGRFVEAWRSEKWSRLYRHEVKLQLCGSTRAKDSNIRQVLIDRWGGQDKAIGKKGRKVKGAYPHSTVGPLYGIGKDMWQALGLAVAWWELNPQPPDEET